MSGGAACIFGSAIPRERNSCAPQFCGFSYTYAYISLMLNDQIWHDNTYGDGLVFISATQMRRAVCQRQLSVLYLPFLTQFFHP